MSEKLIQVAPSILSADFRILEKEVKAAEQAGADLIHCDVMDGHFVPNITFGPLVVEAVKRCVSRPLDVHLMISNPEKYITAFADAGSDTITVHAEVCADLPGVIQQIRQTGVRVGITVNPDKDIQLFLPYLSQIDQVLIMTVYAGFGGQKFMPEMMGKVARVNEAAKQLGKNIDIQVDGGINHETAATCAQNGANVFVAGSYIFGSDDYAKRIEAVRAGAKTGMSK
ncbi:MAG: ribulose-phosphate 3-epimerase [Chitinivibrionales bacterium]